MSGARPAAGAVLVRPAVAADADRIAAIYNHHVVNTIVTFEEEPVAPVEMADRIAVTMARYPWLVAEVDGAVAGYACAAAWKPRSAYRFTVETSIYLGEAYTGRGIGRILYPRLLADLRTAGVCSAIGGIALPNAASVALHERLGFVAIGRFRAVGWKFGRWIDVGYWQLGMAQPADALLQAP